MYAWNHPIFPVARWIVAGVVLGLTGCASRPGHADTAEIPHRVVVGESGYRAVKITGSHIPVLVPTSPTARPLPPVAPVRTISPEEFERMVDQRGHR